MKRALRLLLLLLCGLGTAVGPAPPHVALAASVADVSSSHYDARVAFNRTFRPPRSQAMEEAVLALSQETTDLAVDYDVATASVRSLTRHVGYLTEARPGQDALVIATEYVQENATLFGLEESDLADDEVSDRVYSAVTGATHVYLRQTHRGLSIYGTQLHVNVDREGRLLSVNNSFLPGLSRIAGVIDPALDLGAAVLSGAIHAGIAVSAAPREVEAPVGLDRASAVDPAGISLEPIRGRLMWLPIRAKMTRLVWNFQIHTTDRQHVYDITVDAADGKVWTRFDQMSGDSYRVYAAPAESPNHVSPSPPADGRTLVANPASSNASPFGWHDTNGAVGAEFTTTQGNNVHAYTDTDKNNIPDAGSSPSGGAGLAFDFPIDLGQAPSAYRPAAVTNLFYWINLIHDVQYQYGFDEAAGNFQVNNYGKFGEGNDDVRAEAQDGAGLNNANFFTPPDGSRPRMQVYVWSFPNPDRAGEFDSGLVIHEYGHGISNRLVGGPNNVNCLTNNQQPGEGLSDWWALAYTHKPGDTGADPRGIGTYTMGQPTNGLGLRAQRYSTSPLVNSWTYESMNAKLIPHGVGAVWAQAAWEVYWKLVDTHGFDANLYNATGNAGNQRMMLYVNEGLKYTACNPTFTQVRDAILQAASQLHGGEDVCRMWQAFAAFGLGTDAVSGGPNSTTPINGFSVPPTCEAVNLPPVANAGPDQNASVNTLVSLSGSASSDPDGGPSPLGYLWAQISGPSVTLSNPTSVNTNFTPTAAGTFVFRLTVNDGWDSGADDVTVTVTNQPPVSNAGPDQTVAPSTPVTLSGNGSSDPDGWPGPLGYSWAQISGPSVTVTTPTSVSAHFTPTLAGTYVFRLTVSDGADTDTDDVTVNVPNLPPVANAGPDQNAIVDTLVTLSGSGSSDPDSWPGPLGYSWAQISGPSVTLSAPTSVSTSFTAALAGTYVFRLTVTDGVATATDDITVTVTGGGGSQTAAFDPVLQAPRCSAVGRSCDTGPSLVLGRAALGPEPNQPNTIADSCADGPSGTFHSDESNDRIVVSTIDGTDFAPGKTVRIDATVWAWSTPAADGLDLYYAANANNPAWTFIATLTPTASGAQTLSATYTLPSGALQAVRAQFRYEGAASPCASGSYHDRDDLVFAVTGGAGGVHTAVFDPELQAPRCSAVGISCDTASLVLGRADLGPEPNQSNTIDSCVDGPSGTFHSDESNDRIVVSTTDGTNFAPGKTVRIEAMVWAWTDPSSDHLDLYYAADANNPVWTLIATLAPTGPGAQTLSATYTLPSGALQAVRAQFRYEGSASSCASGSYIDRDDVVFAVSSGP